MNRWSMDTGSTINPAFSHTQTIKSNLHPSKAELRKASAPSSDLITVDEDTDVPTIDNQIIMVILVGAIAVGLLYTLIFLKRNPTRIYSVTNVYSSVKRFIFIRSIRI